MRRSCNRCRATVLSAGATCGGAAGLAPPDDNGGKVVGGEVSDEMDSVRASGLFMLRLRCAICFDLESAGRNKDTISKIIAAAASGISHELFRRGGGANSAGLMVLKWASSFSRRAGLSLSGAGCAGGSPPGGGAGFG